MNYNFESMTTEELMKLVQEFEDQKNEFNQMQYALKIAMNSIYGAFCNVGFNYFNIEVAESITTQGRSLIQFGMESIDRYFSEMWHKDIELHKHLGINSPEQLKPVVFYGDTDSVAGDTKINCANNTKIKIEDMFNQYMKYSGFYISNKGHEIIDNNNFMIDIKNYDNKSGKIYDAKIKKLIRHKVSKPKWVVKTKQGLEVEITEDHSLVVFRDGIEVEIKPKDVVIGDKVVRIIT